MGCSAYIQSGQIVQAKANVELAGGAVGGLRRGGLGCCAMVKAQRKEQMQQSC